MSEVAEVPDQITQPEYPKPKVNPAIEPTGVSNSEKSEMLGNKVDFLMVFGQGPVKPLLQESELNEEQKVAWAEFKKESLQNTEPDFRVIEGSSWTSQLEGLSKEQQDAKIALWQTQGRFGLNRWGRENALAAGFALVSGSTGKVLLSGGKTIPAWARESLPPSRLDKWPSEAELMKDIIARRFGKLYEESNPGKKIEDMLILEDASTNTLENVANTLNQNPNIIEDQTKLGLLAANFHIERSERIGAIFAPGKEVTAVHGAQDLLEVRNEDRKAWKERGILDKLRRNGAGEADLAQKVDEMKVIEANKITYKRILSWMNDTNNPDLQARQLGEKRFMIGLSDPEYINYWLGYIGLCEDPAILQNTIQGHKKDGAWTDAARGAFKEAGLDYDELVGKDLAAVPKDEFLQIAKKLTVLKEPGHRAMPPPQTS